MTTEELIKRALLHLDDDRVRYPEDEVIYNGLNPAQDLLALMRPHLHHTHVVSLPAQSAFIDLYPLDPHIVDIDRVVAGDQGFDATTEDDLARHQQLEMTHLETLAGTHPRWYTTVGRPRRYYRHGRTLLGIWPRPPEAITLTIQAQCVPTGLSKEDFQRASELEASDHELIGDVAYAMLLVKEGAVEVDKAFSRLALLLQHEAMDQALAHIRRKQREWPAHVEVAP